MVDCPVGLRETFTQEPCRFDALAALDVWLFATRLLLPPKSFFGRQIAAGLALALGGDHGARFCDEIA